MDVGLMKGLDLYSFVLLVIIVTKIYKNMNSFYLRMIIQHGFNSFSFCTGIIFVVICCGGPCLCIWFCCRKKGGVVIKTSEQLIQQAPDQTHI